MTLSPDLALIEASLDRLEQMEVRVLVWGLVDSALSLDEVNDALCDVLNSRQNLTSNSGCTIDTEDALRENLISLGYVAQIPGRDGSPPRFRTRMAEGVRLFSRLRQLFPHRHEDSGWVSAGTLVADYRLLWRQRKYPARDLTPEDSRELIGLRVSDPFVMSTVKAWFDAGGPSWKFARFQIDASARILEGLTNRTPRGTLVSAGTGSGKTLAFYLPALSWLASERKRQPESNGVRVLAIYPRNELLKDQLAEVFNQARKFDNHLGKSGSTLSIGVFYGDTPYTLKSTTKKWDKTRGECPFFRCPEPHCNGGLRVVAYNMAESDGRLVCVKCGSAVETRHLRFTREAMTEEPPDILFTSVEMMNQRLGDSDTRHLFGLGPKATRVPPLMLLDEVHLYTGTFGAQTAHLLRRWSHLSRHQTQFVGLSATISEGAAFFASLIGMDRSVVEEIAPNPEHMKSEGAEYMLALRGDPVSQTALLSTSIQSLMLASRLLDPQQQFIKGERPFSGWRTFAFTDQMDATNRLFYNLLDAEGRNEKGERDENRHPNGGLAHLRRQGDLRRYEGGQDWRFLESIGHDLNVRQRVARTTALDAGVNHEAEIVVATSALEVGYDDPAVGVVLQHKAPRDMAQFLQRKGRAGRTRHMRPWTIMVLSDYGRDRLAYQTYEQFFDPELPSREIPLSNRYIRRMQATYAVIDYLGVVMQQGEPSGSVWRDLGTPEVISFNRWNSANIQWVKSNSKKFPLTIREWKDLQSEAVRRASEAAKYDGKQWLQTYLRRRKLVEQLAGILRDPARTEHLARYLSHALSIPREEIDTLMWEHPRPLLLSVLPTALRRLATNWRSNDQVGADHIGRSPLPEFIPSTLFSDLTLPEVLLLGGPYKYKHVALPVQQALNEIAPGKVSRRLDYALWIGLTGEQLALDIANEVTERDVDIDPWFELNPEQSFHLVEHGQITECAAWRPNAIKLSGLPQNPKVRDTSNARLIWSSQLFGRRVGNCFDASSSRVGISRLVDRVEIYTHASQSAATVRRYAIGSNVSLRVSSGNNTKDYAAVWRFTKDGKPCGVGFEIEVDAICFHMQLPNEDSVSIFKDNPNILRASRNARYQWEAQYGPALATVTGNVFFRGWLAQIFKVAVIALAQESDCSLGEAIEHLRLPSGADRLQAVLLMIFQSQELPQDDEDLIGGTEPRLRSALRAAFAETHVRAALAALATDFMVSDVDSSWEDWIYRVQMHTFAAALNEAIQQACPQIDPDDLIIDTNPGPTEYGTIRPDAQLWITESNPGGNGLVEQIAEVISTRPEHFYRRIEAALRPSEFEQIDIQLSEFIHHIGRPEPDEAWEHATLAVRSASSSEESQKSLLKLRQFLSDQGHAVFHSYISALSNRLLRPDSPRALDCLLAELLEGWEDLECSLGVEVDARIMCAVFSRDARLDHAFTMAGFVLPSQQIETWRFTLLLGVLWARGHALRSHSLPIYERFADTQMPTDRLFLTPWLSKEIISIEAISPSMLEELHEQLRDQGQSVVSMPSDASLIHSVISQVATNPVQLEYLNVYPRLTSVIRSQGVVALHFELEATT